MKETRKEGVIVNLAGFNSHLGNISLGISMKALSKRLYLGGNIHTK